MTSKRHIELKKFVKLLLGIVDVAATLFTLLLASFIVNYFNWDKVTFDTEYLIITIIVLITWIVLLKTTHLAKIPRTSSWINILIDFFKLSLIGGLILLLSDLIITVDSLPSIVIALFVGLNMLILFAIRVITLKTVRVFRANGHNTRNIVIIANEFSRHFINKVLSQKEWGFQILYIITDSDAIKKEFGNKVKIHSKSVNIKSLVKFDMVDEVLFFDELNSDSRFMNLIAFCEDLGVTVRAINKHILPESYRYQIDYFDTIPFYTIRNNPIDKFHHVTKTALEIAASIIILFVLSPLLLLVSIAIKLTSKGPVIFKQERVGRRGRKFYIYKFRTMVINAEELKEKLAGLNESDGPTFKIKKDPRITPIGSLLRKTNLDEIPQLFNIIKGEMSLIGPRPPLPSEVEKYEEWQLKRLSVKPGLTCTWQIVPDRNNVKFDNWVEMDIQYIDNWSLKNDFALFFKTFKSVFFARGA